MEPLYAHVVDVLRKFSPTLTEQELDNNEYIGVNDREKVRARLDEVCDEFETETGRAFRERRVGAPGAPKTYDEQDVKGGGHSKPLRVQLRNITPGDIMPLDPNEGDSLQIRVGKNRWEDVTNEEGDTWQLNYKTGRLKVYRRLVRRIYLRDPEDRYVKATFRYGALGGSKRRGGQTALASSTTDSDTTWSVENAERLPSTGVFLVDNSEYVRGDVDYQNGEVEVKRGIRATTAESHDAGDVVHYCPLSIRSAVAARAAQELLRYDDWVDELREASQSLGGKEKMDSWQDEWEKALGRHSGVRKL